MSEEDSYLVLTYFETFVVASSAFAACVASVAFAAVEAEH